MTDNNTVMYVPVDGECVIHTDEYGTKLVLRADKFFISYGGGNLTMEIEFPPDFTMCKRVGTMQTQGVNGDGQ